MLWTQVLRKDSEYPKKHSKKKLGLLNFSQQSFFGTGTDQKKTRTQLQTDAKKPSKPLIVVNIRVFSKWPPLKVLAPVNKVTQGPENYPKGVQGSDTCQLCHLGVIRLDPNQIAYSAGDGHAGRMTKHHGLFHKKR